MHQYEREQSEEQPSKRKALLRRVLGYFGVGVAMHKLSAWEAELLDEEQPERRMGYTVDTGEWAFPDSGPPMNVIYAQLERKYRQ